VEQEADETAYWLELLAQSEIIEPELLTELMTECDELLAIFVATGKTARRG
jgi:four helix bundle protein